MEKLLIFAVVSVPVIAVSLRSLTNIRNHGFYRFFGWECMLWLLLNNYSYWFVDALSVTQLASWILLFAAIYPAIAGLVHLRKYGNVRNSRKEKNLYAFEKTTELVDKGIYHYIRHPMYASLILLTWGIFFKHVTVVLFFVSVLASVFLYLTAKLDEKECMAYFGETYRDYKKKSKMFLPFLI